VVHVLLRYAIDVDPIPEAGKHVNNVVSISFCASAIVVDVRKGGGGERIPTSSRLLAWPEGTRRRLGRGFLGFS
jgi:hypothetical protein